jgi:hypothetical protein
MLSLQLSTCKQMQRCSCYCTLLCLPLVLGLLERETVHAALPFNTCLPFPGSLPSLASAAQLITCHRIAWLLNQVCV